MHPRAELAAALEAAGPAELSVYPEEPATAPALPALVIRPGQPYRVKSSGPRCRDEWRLQVVALVPIDAVAPLDALDALVDLVRDVVGGIPLGVYVRVPEAAVQLAIAGKPHRASVVDVQLTESEV